MRTVPQVTLEQAAAKVRAGDVLIVGGFGMTGNPTNIMHALAETEVKDLTYIGNLQYRMTENNFNMAAATAADLVIAEVEEIVPAGALDPDFIHTPGCFVDYLVQAGLNPEHLGTSASVAASLKKVDEARMSMARLALAELKRGDIVNLGVGIPTLVADLIKPEDGIVLHSENGMLGVGPEPETGGAMEYPINAGKAPATALPGVTADEVRRKTSAKYMS